MIIKIILYERISCTPMHLRKIDSKKSDLMSILFLVHLFISEGSCFKVKHHIVIDISVIVLLSRPV